MSDKFVIDRSIWRCGQDSENKAGEGKTQMLNKEGYMCCLGQISRQLGVSDENLLNEYKPGDVEGFEGNILVEAHFQNTELSIDAMPINDDVETTKEEKEKLLIDLFVEHDVELTFTGEY